MEYYFDIKALPNPEIIQSTVVGYLMQGLHGLLPKFEGRIGLAFPAYGQQRTLGGIIRALGSHEDIEDLYDATQILSVFSDYALITPICAVPERVAEHVKYKRYHVKGYSRFKRLEKRLKSRGLWTNDIAEAAAKKFGTPTRLPHVHLQSSSTGQKFILFIKRENRLEPASGKFNAYGLSLGQATVPHF